MDESPPIIAVIEEYRSYFWQKRILGNVRQRKFALAICLRTPFMDSFRVADLRSEAATYPAQIVHVR